MGITVFAVLIGVFALGLAVGSLGTVVVFFLSRQRVVEHTFDAPLPTDSSNPYEPSRTTTRLVGASAGCGVATVLLLLVAAGLLGMVMWASPRAVAPVPLPPGGPPPSPAPAPSAMPGQP